MRALADFAACICRCKRLEAIFFFHSLPVSVVEPKCVINPSDCRTLFSEISFSPEKASLEKLRHKAVSHSRIN